jgi:hypothetical protein
MTIRVSDLDPFGGIGDELARDESLGKKMTHHWEEGQRVRLRPSGRTGKIKTINNRGDLNVMLDSGHFVQCMDTDDCEPEDWAETVPKPAPPSMTASEKAFAKAHSPYGWLEDDEPSALDKKLEAAVVSVDDQVLIKRCTENIENHRTVVDPLGLGDYEDENTTMLRIMSEKYPALPTSDVLAKRARSGLRVGQKVRCNPSGTIGTITSIEGNLVKVRYDDGSGEIHSVVGYESLIPVEATA